MTPQHFDVNQVNYVFFSLVVKDYQLIQKCGQEGSDSQTQLRQYLQHFVLISTHLLQTSMDSSYAEAVETTWVLSLALKGLYRTLKVPDTEYGREIKIHVLPCAAGAWVLTEPPGESAQGHCCHSWILYSLSVGGWKCYWALNSFCESELEVVLLLLCGGQPFRRAQEEIPRDNILWSEAHFSHS